MEIPKIVNIGTNRVENVIIDLAVPSSLSVMNDKDGNMKIKCSGVEHGESASVL